MRKRLTAFAFIACLLGRAPEAGAHRLDEYLQATLVTIDRDRVGVELGLTAGISVAPSIFASIDSNGDGRLARDEQDAYARQVLAAIDLTIDGRPATLTLADSRFPDYAAMSDGTGTIHLRATAELPAMSIGRHALSYRNGHWPAGSVYLVNTLIPSDSRIQLSTPKRDQLQRSFAVEYSIALDPIWVRTGWMFAALGMIGVLARRAVSAAE